MNIRFAKLQVEGVRSISLFLSLERQPVDFSLLPKNDSNFAREGGPAFLSRSDGPFAIRKKYPSSSSLQFSPLRR